MALTTLHQADHNVVGVLDSRLIVFVRSAPLTPAALDVIEAEVRRAVVGDVRPVACFAIVPGDAGMSASDLLERQRTMVKTFVADAQTSFAMVVLGGSIQSVMMRSFIRVSFLGKGGMKLTDDVHDAAGWLAPRMHMSVAEVEAAADALRARM